MKKHSNMLVAILLMAALLVTLCVPAMAETTFTNEDEATVTITGLKPGVEVTLYQIVKAGYDETGFTGYEAVNGVAIDNPLLPTYKEITVIANAINGNTVNLDEVHMKVTDTTAEADVGAGIWLALVTGGGSTIYNPMVVSAYYVNEDGTPIMKGGTADAGKNSELEGGTAVAKSSAPTVDKTVNGEDEVSASVDDTVTYTITAGLPSYPAEATNKTFYVEDTLSDGLQLQADTIKVNGETANDQGEFVVDGKVIARLKVAGNTFTIVFDYEQFTAAPTVTYDAYVNDYAVVGTPGNGNTVTMVYSNNPTNGETWTDPEKEDEKPEPDDPNYGKDTAEATVYTYRVAFKKVDSAGAALKGAEFGIYSDKNCTNLIDKVTTNENGYAASKQLAEGTYYVKEITAPAGYSLNTNVYEIKATKDTAVNTAYTTVKPSENAESVGWILDGVFSKENPGNGAEPAYVASTTTTAFVVGAGDTNNNGIELLDTDIPNTKVSELPSTGGMGTTLFIVGGVALMALAVVLLMKKRKAAN